MAKGAGLGVAAVRSGMHRNTAAKWSKESSLPSETREPRSWRTREDPFESVWPELEARLRAAPGLTAKTLFDELIAAEPDRYQPGQLRTLQRRVKIWRAESGPVQELFFAQRHRAGEAAQTDFTDAKDLAIQIGGEPFKHLLCVVSLPYSGWSWATPCLSESLAALRKGVQEAFFHLGRVPAFHQTDNSTSATHNLQQGKRAFNEDYAALMRHLGMTPRTTGIGKKEQNGHVEASNGVIKRYLEQQLLLRDDRSFGSKSDYVSWLTEAMTKRNRSRRDRLTDELAVMKRLTVTRLPEFSEVDVRVGCGATIRVKKATYSVPSRMRGERVRVRVFDDRLEIYFAQRLQLEVDRVHGKGKFNINYRHIVDSMLRKPGAFARYRYREALFPTPTFREAFERLEREHDERRSALEYLRIVREAATTMEAEVEAALRTLMGRGEVPSVDAVRAITSPKPPRVPELACASVDLAAFDGLLTACEEVNA